MKIKKPEWNKERKTGGEMCILKKGEGTRNGREVDRVTSLGEC